MKPYFSQTLKREDGSRIKITVKIEKSNWGLFYRTHVAICASRKRKFVEINPQFSNMSCRLYDDEWWKEKERLNLQYASKEEIYITKKQLWTNIKPS